MTGHETRRIISRTALVLLAVLAIPAMSCKSLVSIPEENPHPPVISNLRISPAAVPLDGSILVTFNYFDEGADIETATARDKESGRSYTLVILETSEGITNPFPGTSGTTAWTIIKLRGSQVGPHTIRVWLVDSFSSWSNALEATVTVAG